MTADTISGFDKYVIRGILANNELGIAKVLCLQEVKSMLFVFEEYPKIEELIKAGDINAIQSFQNNQQDSVQSGFREYLEIMRFKDQSDFEYLVAVYDNDALEQDCQVIEIFKL